MLLLPPMTETVKSAASDIPNGHWVDRLAPRLARPYLRLARIDRPIGTWLLLFPGWWSLALASGGMPDPWLFALFAIGAVVMRGAGCTVNDIADRDVDGKVARTATRPIPSGEVTVAQALVFLYLLSAVGLLILLRFNPFAQAVGAFSLVPVAVYPLMKRITHWPQAVLGLTFNWGALLGWAAVRGDLDWPPVVLYGAGLFWTLGYDTIYAHQDKEDDAMVGIKSTALRLGDATRPWLFGFYGLTLALMALSGWLVGLNWPFFAGLVLAGGHLAWQAARVDIHDPANCLAKFKSNRHFGWLVLASILAGYL